MIRLAFLILFCSFSWATSAQQIIVGSTLAKDSVKIGERNTITYNIRVQSPIQVKGVDYSPLSAIESEVLLSGRGDTIKPHGPADIEWITQRVDEKFVLKPDDFKKTEKGLAYENKIDFIIWDIGVFKMLNPVVEIDSNRVSKVVELQPSYVFVMPPKGIQPQDTTQILMPLAPIIQEPTTWRDYLWIAYVVIPLLLAFLAFYLWRRHKRKQESEEKEEVVIIRPAHEIALERLDELKKKELWQQGKVKVYQSELTYSIREYLENRYDIQALESTTKEIIGDLKEANFDSEYEAKLTKILQMADLVKFAKANPTESIHEEFMNDAYEFVENTKRIIIEAEDGVD